MRQSGARQTREINRGGDNVGATRCRRIVALVVLSAACLAVGIRPQVVEVGHTGPRIWVREGDIICLRYTQSMYGVPVEERFRVEGGGLFLFEVDTTGAALEYLGILSRGAGNVSRFLQEFFVPADSVGSHSLSVGGRRIALADVPAKEGRISIRLTRQPLIVYLVLAIGNRY